jgi:hypothetical protein
LIEGGKVRRQTLLFTVLANVLHGRGLQITDQGHVLTSFGNRLLVHTQVRRGTRAQLMRQLDEHEAKASPGFGTQIF